MKALDLFCGLGGWSDGLAAEDFDVTGVELVPMIAALYRHKVILADCRYLPLRSGVPWDLIVGSPPCREFTAAYSGNWKVPRDFDRGLILVNAFLDAVTFMAPRYWFMENVPGLTKHIDLKPRVKARLGKGMYRCFWGTFPAFLVPLDYNKKIFHLKGVPSKLRSWYRARIPLAVARSLGRAVKTAISLSAWRHGAA